MSYIIESWLSKSLLKYLETDHQDTTPHNLQIIEILGKFKLHTKIIVSDGSFFIPAYLNSNNLVKESFINIKKYYIEYFDKKFVLFVSDFILIGGVSDVIRNPKDINKKYCTYLKSELYSDINDYLLVSNAKLEENIFENIIVHERENENKIDFNNLDSNKTENEVVNKKTENKTLKNNNENKTKIDNQIRKIDNQIDVQVDNIFSSSFILSNIDNTYLSENYNNDSFYNNKDYSLNINRDFLFISDKPFRENPHILNRTLNTKRSNFPVNYRIQRGVFELKILKHKDLVRNIQNFFIKKIEYKYTTRNKNKYFNLINEYKKLYEIRNIDEYVFLNDEEEIMFDISELKKYN